jgi:antitoxin component of MazEF toxin-antitoxin module
VHGRLVSKVQSEIIVSHQDVSVIIVNAHSVVAKAESSGLVVVSILGRLRQVEFTEYVLLDAPSSGGLTTHFHGHPGWALVDIHTEVKIQVQVIHIGQSQTVILPQSVLQKLAVVEVLLQVDIPVANATFAAQGLRANIKVLGAQEQVDIRGWKQVEIVVRCNTIRKQERLPIWYLQVCRNIIVS